MAGDGQVQGRIRLATPAGLQVKPAAITVEPLDPVGVVITGDHTIPMSSQYVVRAPGYMMKVYHASGVSFYLLDGEGRHRHGRIRGANFTTGIPAVERNGRGSTISPSLASSFGAAQTA